MDTHGFVMATTMKTVFHFNWGWGGTYDGFYALDAVKPASNYNLTFHQGAIINLFPDNEDYTIENMEVGNKNVTPEENS